MTRTWEYREVELHRLTNLGELNVLGADGWRVVGTPFKYIQWCVLMERETTPTP